MTCFFRLERIAPRSGKLNLSPAPHYPGNIGLPSAVPLWAFHEGVVWRRLGTPFTVVCRLRGVVNNVALQLFSLFISRDTCDVQ